MKRERERDRVCLEGILHLANSGYLIEQKRSLSQCKFCSNRRTLQPDIQLCISLLVVRLPRFFGALEVGSTSGVSVRAAVDRSLEKGVADSDADSK
jgi:hypothetical protein